MSKISEDPLIFLEFLNVAQELNQPTRDGDIVSDNYIHLSDIMQS